MTKEIAWNPNERVDVPDMQAGTNVLAKGVSKDLMQQVVLDRVGRTLTGFRVEIPNQVSSPGELTVHNGYSLDRDGNPLINGDEDDTARSIVLGADGQYFLEVLYVLTPSDTDARGFWDPSFDNGTDPSGDPRLPGREFNQNVSTRMTPDWQLVTPVSTTGFDFQTSPNSLKVPVAVIQVSGGVIVNSTLVPAQTALARDATAGDTKVFVFDSRIFPDTGTMTIGGVSVTITANDRRNGILSLSAGLGINHATGERVVQTGVGIPQFLVERKTPPLPATQSRDARLRMWQGNEDRGFGVVQDPGSTARADLSIETLKDMVDALAAQIREMKFGSSRSTLAGKTAGPDGVYPGAVVPRWYDPVQGLQGGRLPSVTVADGTSAYGDFNVSLYADASACFAAAIASLPAGGGIVFVKTSTGTYDFTSGTVHIPTGMRIRMIGENGTIVLHSIGANPCFFVDGAKLELENLQIRRGGGSTAPGMVRFDDNATTHSSVSARSCVIEGVYMTSNSSLADSSFENTYLLATGGNHFAFSGDMTNCSFLNCTLATDSDSNAGALCLLTGSSTYGTLLTSFQNCSFITGFGPTTLVQLGSGGKSVSNTQFDNCTFQSPTNVMCILATGGAYAGVQLLNCKVPFSSSGLLYIDNAVETLVDGCVASSVVGHAVRLGTSTNNKNMTVRNCHFTQGGGTDTGWVGFFVEFGDQIRFLNSVVDDYDVGFQVVSGNIVAAEDLLIQAIAPGAHGWAGIKTITDVSGLYIRNCRITGMSSIADGGIAAGIKIFRAVDGLVIDGCRILGIGTTGGNAYGIYMTLTSGVGDFEDCVITNNEIFNLGADITHSAHGIHIDNNLFYSRIIGNSLWDIGTTSLSSIGIALAGFDNLVVANNSISGVGNSTVPNKSAGIHVTSGNQLSVECTVTGNVIKDIDAAVLDDQCGCIVFDSVGIGVVISDNICQPVPGAGGELYGIRINNQNTTTVAQYVISNNQIGNYTSTGDLWMGIRVTLLGPGGADASERFTINGNHIADYTVDGILVETTGVHTARRVTICGNVVDTGFNGLQNGIHMFKILDFAVTGNVLTFRDGNSHDRQGIGLDTCFQGVVSGNYVNMSEMSATYAIYYMTNCGDTLITGNYAILFGVGAGEGIRAVGSTNCYATGNVLHLPGGNTAWTGVNSKAQTNSGVVPSEGTNPSGTTDIGLNISY